MRHLVFDPVEIFGDFGVDSGLRTVTTATKTRHSGQNEFLLVRVCVGDQKRAPAVASVMGEIGEFVYGFMYILSMKVMTGGMRRINKVN